MKDSEKSDLYELAMPWSELKEMIGDTLDYNKLAEMISFDGGEIVLSV